MFLRTLGGSLLGNLLTGKGTIRPGEGTFRVGQDFEIQKCYQNETKFNGVYLKNSLPKIKDGPYVINLDEFKSIGSHWISLYVNVNNRKNFGVT